MTEDQKTEEHKTEEQKTEEQKTEEQMTEEQNTEDQRRRYTEDIENILVMQNIFCMSPLHYYTRI